MYIERKGGALTGEARIGLVTFSRTGRTFYYTNKAFIKVKGGYKYNCIEVETRETYWISGCKKNGCDGLYKPKPVFIDKDCRPDYWTIIRQQPELADLQYSN